MPSCVWFRTKTNHFSCEQMRSIFVSLRFFKRTWHGLCIWLKLWEALRDLTWSASFGSVFLLEHELPTAQDMAISAKYALFAPSLWYLLWTRLSLRPQYDRKLGKNTPTSTRKQLPNHDDYIHHDSAKYPEKQDRKKDWRFCEFCSVNFSGFQSYLNGECL